eukprot:m.201115 g.201115  ORF g.201115 m.201115 type:complete len:1120 (+) comp16862_c0_seq1:94-3453(+)
MTLRIPPWAIWRKDYFSNESFDLSILTNAGDHPVQVIVNGASLFVLSITTHQPVFAIDLSRCKCEVSGTADLILAVRIVLSLAAHPNFVENNRVHFRATQSHDRNRLLAIVQRILKNDGVGINLGQDHAGETTTEARMFGSTATLRSGAVARVALDTLTVRMLQTTALQLREIRDRLGLFANVLMEDLTRAASLVSAEFRLLQGLKQTLLAPMGEDGECIRQLRSIAQSILRHSLPWVENGAAVLQQALKAQDFSSHTVQLLARLIEHIYFFSDMLAWIVHAHVMFTKPSSNQETADFALRLSQLYYVLAERPRSQHQLTALTFRLTYASQELLSMINVAYMGREVEGELRQTILQAVQVGMALQDALCKFMVSPPLPFEFDVLVAHCFHLGAVLLEVLHAAKSCPEWDYFDFETMLSIEWAKLDPLTTSLLPHPDRGRQQPSSASQYDFFDSFSSGMMDVELTGEAEEDDGFDFASMLSVHASPLENAMTVNQVYHDHARKILDTSKQLHAQALVAQNYTRDEVVTLLQKLGAFSNKLICVDPRDSSSRAWSHQFGTFYSKFEHLKLKFAELTRKNGSRLPAAAVREVLQRIQECIALGEPLLTSLERIIQDQQALVAKRSSSTSSAQLPASQRSSISAPQEAVASAPRRVSMDDDEEESEEVLELGEDATDDTDDAGVDGVDGEDTSAEAVADVIYLTVDRLKQLQTSESANKVVAAASLPQLVSRITRSDRFDPKLTAAVILTYHTFTTGQELLNALIARFEETTKPGTDKNVGFQVRTRVLNVIKRWLIDNAEDFRKPELAQQLHAFLTKQEGQQQAAKLCTMLSHIEACQRGSTANLFTNSGARRHLGLDHGPSLEEASRGGIPAVSKLDLCQLNVREIATQLTIWHWQLFSQVTPHDLIGKPATNSPTKKLLAKHFDVTSCWVMANILCKADKAKRVNMLKTMVRLTEELLSLGNYDLMYAAYLGIKHSSIVRLKQTWKMFRDKHPRSTALHEQHEHLCGDMHFGRIRVHMKDRRLQGQPCLPVIALYNNDLLKRESADEDTVDNKGVKLINIKKRMNMAVSIEELREFQRLAYSLPPKPIIQDYLNTGFIQQIQLSSAEAAERSRAIEPPES